MFAKALTFVSLLSATLAIPEVTIKELPAGCASYPLYNAETGEAGPWSVMASNSDNTAIEKAGGNTVYSVSYTPETGPVMRWGYITVNERVDLARRALKCADGKLQTYTQTALNRAGAPINVQWTPLVLSPYPYDASLLYLIDGEQPSIYEHYVGEEKQDGVYLGGYNTTTWGVKWYAPNQGSSDQPFYYLRLLPEGEALKANETKTFIRIQA